MNTQAVITLSMMDQVHSRPDGTARKRFNDNKEKLIEGEDYFVRLTDEAKSEFNITAPNGLTILTETGYLLLVKSFTDELAWQIQRQLVKAYFAIKQPRPSYPGTADELFTGSDTNNVSQIVWRIANPFHYNGAWTQAIWRSLRLAANTPSPQRFRVADLPLIVAELRRLWAVSQAADAFITEAETTFLKHAIRKGEDIGPLIAGQRLKLQAAIQDNATAINGVLSRWNDQELLEVESRTPSPRYGYGTEEK